MEKILASILVTLFAVSTNSCNNDYDYDVNSSPTIRILCIGSSLSEDAVEQYLHDLGMAQGYNIIVGNLYHGGCSTNKHWEYASTNALAYEFRYINSKGKRIIRKKYSVERGLAAEPWDFVSLQQAGEQSGLYPTHPERFRPALDSLIQYVHTRVPQAKILWHETWAYDTWTSDQALQAYYNGSQKEWYERITTTSQCLFKELPFHAVIPSGTAIQHLRERETIGDSITRDGAHLNLTWGRYTASLVWLYKLTGKTPVGFDYGPVALTIEERKRCQQAAAQAIKEWSKYTR